MTFLRSLARRIATVAALLFGVALAAVFAALALASALAIGAAMWLANRFGLRTVRPDRGAAGPRGGEVIDVEMREIAPDAQEAASNADADEATTARTRPQSDEGPRGP